jgi:putative FmdB family regulatory protein
MTRGRSDVPLYEYQCPACGNFEVIQKFSDAPLSACPTCGQGVSKLPSAPAFHLKGSGWYLTDYARKGNGDGKGEGAGAGESKATGAAESKPSASGPASSGGSSTPASS